MVEIKPWKKAKWSKGWGLKRGNDMDCVSSKREKFNLKIQWMKFILGFVKWSKGHHLVLKVGKDCQHNNELN